jgi:hypothetical protein
MDQLFWSDKDPMRLDYMHGSSMRDDRRRASSLFNNKKIYYFIIFLLLLKYIFLIKSDGQKTVERSYLSFLLIYSKQFEVRRSPVYHQ